jgi:hypothetical protein
MALTAFTSRLGISQGRIRQADDVADGYAFILGDAEPGHFAELQPGDYVQVSQNTDLTDVGLVRVRFALRVPKSTPPGFAWNACLLIDHGRAAATSAAPGRERVSSELCANVSKLTGMHEVSVRLELVHR